MPKISFRNVKKVYPNGTYALDGINFDIEQGDFVCVIGESGGGKTTLLKIIAGLDKATSGEIYFDGELSNYMKVAQRNVAFVFQEYTIYPNMTVFENIMMSLKTHKISYEEKCELVWDIIQKMELGLIQAELPKSLSFGQCQKVSLARALVRKPQMLLFDEPLSNIDVSAKYEYKKLIMEAKKILPECTFIYVTHNINDAMQLSNKIMVIDNGKIIQFGDKQFVFEYPNSKMVADYMFEGRKEYSGRIEQGKFISVEKVIELTDIQKIIIQEKNIDSVSCYSLGNINIFFDSKGNVIGGFKKYYSTKVSLCKEKIILFNKEYDIGELAKAIIKYGNMNALLKYEDFSFENKEGNIELNGIVIFADKNTILVKLNDLVVPFIIANSFVSGEQISLYYPIDKLKAVDDNNEHVIASYIIADNIIEVKVINPKKGIIKIGKTKIEHEIFVNAKGILNIKLPMDSFVFNKKGKFVCDALYNEESLGNDVLIHFSCREISDYLSALVANEFRGYSESKLRFDIDFSKISCLK